MLPLIPRWRSLCITEFHKHDLSPLIVAHFPTLQEIQLDHGYRKKYRVIRLVQRTMPSLHSFISSRFLISEVFTTLGSLTNLDIFDDRADWRDRAPEDIHKVLSASPHLERLSLRYSYGVSLRELAEYPPVALPMLVKLHLVVSFSNPGFSQIVSYFQAPACMDLKIGTIGSEPRNPPLLMPVFVDFAPKWMSRILKAQSVAVWAEWGGAVTFCFDCIGHRLEIKIHVNQMAGVTEAVNAMSDWTSVTCTRRIMRNGACWLGRLTSSSQLGTLGAGCST